MPKLKNHSGTKKRFKKTASGKIKGTQSGKQHGMTKRSKVHNRDQRGTTILSYPDSKIIIKNFLPYKKRAS